MAGNLNLSMVLRADASGLKTEVKTAGDAVRSFGQQAESSISGQLSGGLSRASRAFTSFKDNITRSLKGASVNVAHQVQDIATQLGTGISPITVLLQQGPQLLSSFGPHGVIVGAVVGGALASGKAYLGAGNDIATAAERAEKSFKDALDAINSSLADGLPAVDKLLKDFEALPSALRGLGLVDFESDLRKSANAVRDQSAALEVALQKLERVAELRLALGGSGRADISGPAGELTRGQAEAIERIAGQFRAGGGTDVAAIREFNAVAGEAGQAVRGLAEEFQSAANESARAVETLRRLETEAAPAISGIADAAERDLGGRTIEQFEGLARARKRNLEGWRGWYDELVGNSIIPNMVTESESWFERMGRSMVGTTTDSAEIVGDAFRGLTQTVGRELGKLATEGEATLSSFLSVVDSITTQILGRLIEAGLNVGINALLTPGGGAGLQPAFTTPGGTPVHTLHSGGLVGRDGVKRLVDPSIFAGAQRLHRGGIAGLRSDEVPAILERGETVSPRGSGGAAPPPVIIINNNNGSRIEKSSERRRPDGAHELTLEIRDEVTRQRGRGDHDRALGARFGLEPRAARR